MSRIQAFEGAGCKLHRYEEDAVVDIIFAAGQGTVRAVLTTNDQTYQPELRDAILRAAEILKKPKRKKAR